MKQEAFAQAAFKPSRREEICAIFGEWNGIGNFVRPSVELRCPADVAQQVAKLRMERRDRHRAKRKARPSPVDTCSRNLMSQQVEGNLHAGPVGNQRGREPARVHVEGGVP